jgi:hypothetical protein
MGSWELPGDLVRRLILLGPWLEQGLFAGDCVLGAEGMRGSGSVAGLAVLACAGCRCPGEPAGAGERGGGVAPGGFVGASGLGSGPEDVPRGVVGDVVLVAPRGGGGEAVHPPGAGGGVAWRVAEGLCPGWLGGGGVLGESCDSCAKGVVEVVQVRRDVLADGAVSAGRGGQPQRRSPSGQRHVSGLTEVGGNAAGEPLDEVLVRECGRVVGTCGAG